MARMSWAPWLLGLGCLAAARAQNVTEIHLVDASRGNKTVSFKLCQPEGPGPWPLYVFGHGFDCNPEDYAYFCAVAATALVYERSFYDVDTAAIAADAAWLASELPRASKEERSSPLYGKLTGKVVLGGHSMGGGTTVLSAAQNSPAEGMVVFAPGLYTRPDATPYLKNVTMPALIVSGSDDCGPNALPKEAQPAYEGLSSKKKVLLVLKGANHCQWTQPTEFLGVCKFPECHNIEREEQHLRGVGLLRAFLRGLSSSWADFEAELAIGEANGTWTYISSVTSPANKTIHNDCPCKSGNAEAIVV